MVNFVKRVWLAAHQWLGLGDDHLHTFTWTVTFADEKLEEEFSKVRARDKVAFARVVLITATIMWLLFLSTDFDPSYKFLPWVYRLSVRGGITVWMMIYLYMQVRHTQHFSDYLDRYFTAIFLIGWALINIMHLWVEEGRFEMPYSSMLLLFMMQCFSNITALRLLIITSLQVLFAVGAYVVFVFIYGTELYWLDVLSLTAALLGCMFAGQISCHGVELSVRQNYLLFRRMRENKLALSLLTEDGTPATATLVPTRKVMSKLLAGVRALTRQAAEGSLEGSQSRLPAVLEERAADMNMVPMETFPDLTSEDQAVIQSEPKNKKILQRLMLSFLINDLEVDYVRHVALTNIRKLKLVACVFLVAEGLFGLQDYWVVSQHSATFLVIRYAIICPLMIAFYFVTPARPFGGVGQQLAIGALMFLAGAANLTLNYLIPVQDTLAKKVYNAVLMRYFMHVFASVRLRFVWSLVVSVPLCLGFCFVEFSQIGMEIISGVSLYIVALCMAGGVASHRSEQRNRFLYLLQRLATILDIDSEVGDGASDAVHSVRKGSTAGSEVAVVSIPAPTSIAAIPAVSPTPSAAAASSPVALAKAREAEAASGLSRAGSSSAFPPVYSPAPSYSAINEVAKAAGLTVNAMDKSPSYSQLGPIEPTYSQEPTRTGPAVAKVIVID